jgi:hypothetical protein
MHALEPGQAQRLQGERLDLEVGLEALDPKELAAHLERLSARGNPRGHCVNG